MTPKSPKAMAILSVVRRDHFRPVMGSPAVSYSSRNSISVTMSVVFFRLVCVRLRNGGCGQSIHSDRAVADVHGQRCENPGQEFGQNAIATMPQLYRFQTSEQSTLLLVEQAVEKQ